MDNLEHDISKELTDTTKIENIVMKMVVDKIYPVGSIYTSMNDKSPEQIFEGTKWEPITDRFLYCVDVSKKAGIEDGSYKIQEKHIPSHGHNVYTGVIYVKHGEIPSHQALSFSHADGSTTVPTLLTDDEPQDYLPPCLTVHAWYRIE